MTPAERRARTLERLASQQFDLLVVGAGIIGSRIAYDAARAGLSVALVDAGDFGCATSSASSKFIHGGLRYLTMGSARLVRAAQAERAALLHSIAPRLVRPMPMVLVVRHGEHAAATLRMGLIVYGALGARGEAHARVVTLREAQMLVPEIGGEGVHACALLPEAQTNDARLTLATVAKAERAGAAVANYVVVEDFLHANGRVGRAVLRSCEGRFELCCRGVVNATGPWLDRIRQLEDSTAVPVTRLSKGAHAVLPLPAGWRAGVAVHGRDDRTTFAVPWHGMLLVGTTDTPYDEDPARVRADAEDIDSLLATARSVLGPELVRRERVRFAFAGLRVLPRGNGDTARARRDHLICVGRRGVVSVAGGKLTLHRRIALEALRALPPELRPRVLPAAPKADTRPLPPELEPSLCAHLLSMYGVAAGDVLNGWREDPQALEPICPGGPDVWAQVRYAAEHEWALEPDDLARRRTTLAIRGELNDALRADLARALRRLTEDG